MWTEEEHARFLDGVKLFSSGPWKRVAAYVGTRNVRQTMTHAQKYRLKAARRLREAQRKQATARYGLHAVQLDSTIKSSSPTRRSLQSPSSSSKGLGLGSYTKMRLPCNCPEKDCLHTPDESKIYMSIADAVEILDSKAPFLAGSPVSTDDAFSNSWLDIGKLDPVVSLEAFGSSELIPLDATAGDSVAFPTLEDCASELLELLF
uniref:Uncharacterized protein n=1 Tax=Hyaloperonospora arabidopsidis (strain Emoy2) TaxID=559515 RepID=M4BTM2_HYAAE